jgi:hypothetical protein
MHMQQSTAACLMVTTHTGRVVLYVALAMMGADRNMTIDNGCPA